MIRASMEALDPLLGCVLSERYRVESLLGEGTMCHVYRGEHLVLRNKVAIKVLDPSASGNEEAVRRFEREALAAANLTHPGIARAVDFGRAPDGRLFIVLEYVDGRPLDRVIAEEAPLEPWRAAHVASQMLSALAHAHEKGIVHRDLKPGNVALVDADRVKILDFGVAKVVSSELLGATDLTQEGLVYGTPGYLSPEQALGRPVDARADLYSVGIVLYEMLVGRPPFVAAEEVRLLIMHVEQPPPPPSSLLPVPAGLEEVVLKLLAKSPADRYPDAQAAIEALEAAEADATPGLVVVEPSEADLGSIADQVRREPTAPEVRPPVRPARARRAGVVTAVAVVLLVGLLAVALLWKPRARAVGRATEAAAAETARPRTAAPATGPRTIEELEALVASYPEDAALRREIAAAHVKRRNLAKAVPQYDAALRLDPALGSDESIQRNLVTALGSPYVWRDAARLLGTIGPAAVEALQRGAVEDGRPRVRERARRILTDSHAELPAWVLAGFAIDDASTCVERSAAIARATGIADRRLLSPLRRRQRTPPRTDRDCDPDEITGAIRALAALPR
jgi:serine/threonine-protein kinase